MIIDFHTHVFPDDLAAGAVPRLAERAGLAAATDGTVDGLLASMDRSGIDLSLVMSIAVKPRQTRKVNDFALRVNERPGLVTFGSVHPEFADWRAELDRIYEAGLPGIKFHLEYQGCALGQGNFMRICDYAAARGLIIMFHTGDSFGQNIPVRITPADAANLAFELAGAKLVFAHMGGWELGEQSLEFLCGQEVYLDTSFAAGFMSDELMRRLIAAHGADRVLFATDSPWQDQAEAVRNFRALRLPPGDEQKILADNARLLLGLGA